jgi:hypothetical protein
LAQSGTALCGAASERVLTIAGVVGVVSLFANLLWADEFFFTAADKIIGKLQLHYKFQL